MDIPLPKYWHASSLCHQVPKCRLTLSYHLRCPEDQHMEAWTKSITNHCLLNFITSHEDLLKSELRNSLHFSSHCEAHVSHHVLLLLSPGTFHARDGSSVSVSQAQPHVHHTSSHQQHHVKVRAILLGRRV
ncbi:hypothetical protein AVEN_216139-1 [Araneus ventricosus]|uniref:Uncharacterized protein n=1 Tax=Araneus ventricosus TaxID=182803 RepID=A0A4Y2VJF1_ARAVE|nr:hypothetical protein AVEN_216139-1 [Araneus ventricosus]